MTSLVINALLYTKDNFILSELLLAVLVRIGCTRRKVEFVNANCRISIDQTHRCSRPRNSEYPRAIKPVNRVNYASVRCNRTEISPEEMTVHSAEHFYPGQAWGERTARLAEVPRGRKREGEREREIIARLGRSVQFLCFYGRHNDKSVS